VLIPLPADRVGRPSTGSPWPRRRSRWATTRRL